MDKQINVAANSKRIRSVFKYPGSKQLMLSTLFKHLPKTGDVLCEPFVGSASVALNTNYRRYLLNDANPDLIRAFKLCRDYPIELISELRSLLSDQNNNPETYYSYRKHFNASTCKDERAIMLFYFSQIGFNGLLRVNSRNELNVPYGDGRSAYLPESEIHTFAEKMQNAEFFCMDFEYFIAMCSQISGRKNQYLDPPYIDTDNGRKTYTQYTAQGFSLDDHARINSVLSFYKSKFEHTLVSNHQSPRLKSTYSGLSRLVRFRVPRTISSKASNRVPAGEVIMYY